MRLLIFILSSFFILNSHAQDPEYKGLLWKITGNGLDKPSYLYGTMHVSNKVAFHLSDSFYMAIRDVDVVALEINPEIWMETMTSDHYIADQMGNAFSIRGDYSTEGFYKAIFKLEAPENRVIGEALGQELGILNSLLYRTSNYNADFEEDTYLDLFIYQAGKKLGKEITGLEQLGLTMRLSEEAYTPLNTAKARKAQKAEIARKRHEIAKLVKDKTFSEVMEDAYRQGNLDLLDSLSRLSNAYEKYHELMIVFRNQGMAKAMDSIMQIKSLFAGVGAAHLPNSYGVINLLREMGYTVEPVGMEKTDFGRDFKDDLEETFLGHEFNYQRSFDNSFGTALPGPLYEFPEANNAMMAAYPDMANGATYVITRLFTFAPLHGMSQSQYMEKIDSLLYENIPGKILEKDRIEINGNPGFDIKNETKKGDHQRYHIMVTPLEIVIYKLGGKKEFAKREEVDQFFADLNFNNSKKESATYSPRNNAYEVDLPGIPVYESEANAFERGYWKKTVQSYLPDGNGYFGVLNRSYSDMRFMEVDSFELSQMARNFVNQFKYEISEWNFDSCDHLSCYTMLAVKEGMPDLRLKLMTTSDQYYLLFAQTDDQEQADQFFESFQLQTYTYSRAFELQRDTTLYFNVTSPVEAVKTNNYYNYYDDDDEEDTSHEQEDKNKTYYCAETDETIFVHYRKYHRYYFETELDSIWKDKRNDLSEEGALYVHREDKWTDGDLHIYEAEATDTNSGRNLLGRFILKGGIMYSIYVETDKHLPQTRYVSEFFSSFEPWDTVIGTPVIQNKSQLFLDDLRSDDSTTKEAAFKSFDVMHFEDEDAPLVMSALERSYSGDHALEIRAELYSKLSYLRHEEILPFLERKYEEIEDTVKLQLPILRGIAAQLTKQSARTFKKLILSETPLSNESYAITRIFYPFDDSLQLVKEMYPDILMLAALPEYKYRVYMYLSSLKNLGYIKKRAYKKNLKQIVWEANNEVKRQKAEEADREADFFETSARYKLYSYNYSLYHYAVLLMPYQNRNNKARKYFERLDKLNSTGLTIDLAVLRLRNGMDVPESVWLDLAKDDNDRIELYNDLKEYELLEYFPEEYSSQETLAISEFADRNNLNILRDSITLVSKELTVIEGDTGYIYFYKIKNKYGDDWHMGYLGMLSSDSTKFDYVTDMTDDDMTYNKFEDMDLQIELQIRKLQMANHPRYRVEDEEKFKDLNLRRSYGY